MFTMISKFLSKCFAYFAYVKSLTNVDFILFFVLQQVTDLFNLYLIHIFFLFSL